MRVVPLARSGPGFSGWHARPILAVPAHDLRQMSRHAARVTAHRLVQLGGVVGRLAALVVLTGVWVCAFLLVATLITSMAVTLATLVLVGS